MSPPLPPQVDRSKFVDPYEVSHAFVMQTIEPMGRHVLPELASPGSGGRRESGCYAREPETPCRPGEATLRPSFHSSRSGGRTGLAALARLVTMTALLAGVVAVAPACSLLPGGPASTVAPPDESSTPDPEPAETAAALAILQRMSAHLAARTSFQFTAEVRYDAVQTSGQRIEFGSERRVAVRRPDRLRVDVSDWDGGGEVLVYDGARVSLALPARGRYASIEQSGSVEEVVDRLEHELGLPMPLAELLQPDLYARMLPLVASGAVVGGVQLDGRACDQLAFRTRGLDFQLFVDRGDAPLPRRLVIDYREEPGRPQFRASLHDWKTDGSLPGPRFEFSPAAGAQRVPFAELLGEVADPGSPVRAEAP